jgi:hypothetical protein
MCPVRLLLMLLLLLLLLLLLVDCSFEARSRRRAQLHTQVKGKRTASDTDATNGTNPIT